MRSARQAPILFIEDIAAKPYQIDRMLMQLKLAGKLAEVRGIIFGEMVDCIQKQQGSRTIPWKKSCCAWSATWGCRWLTACVRGMFRVAT